MIRRFAVAVACLTTILITQLTIAPVAAEPGPVTRVSRAVDGGDPNGKSENASISTSRYVVFTSTASNLVPDDGNLRTDVFVRDMLTGTTTRVNVDTAGGESLGAGTPSISADGRYVAFVSDASDLVVGDGNGFGDVFVRDLMAGSTVRASLDAAGGDTNNWSSDPSLSANGQYVTFVSGASDLVPDDGNNSSDVFVRDLVAGVTVRASVAADGGDSEGSQFSTYYPSISGHGRYVAFGSTASDLVADDGNGLSDVFVRDLAAGTTIRASLDSDGGDPDGTSGVPRISANGQYVAFESLARDLVPGVDNPQRHVYVRDLVAGSTAAVSLDAEGNPGRGWSTRASISGDGRYVAFYSVARGLVPGLDVDGQSDVYVRDMVAGTTAIVSVRPDGRDSAARSSFPAISYEGTYVVFQSLDEELVEGDNNGWTDVFRRRML